MGALNEHSRRGPCPHSHNQHQTCWFSGQTYTGYYKSDGNHKGIIKCDHGVSWKLATEGAIVV